MKIFNIVGARPQIIKSAALSRSIQQKFDGQIEDLRIHTGQHYDANMSEIFFTELKIPKPHYNLQIGSGSHAEQTAGIMVKMEELIEKENPTAIVIYGDTNSTIAAALAASKNHVPVVHIESGMRSFNKSMPEEVNRVLSDHISTLLFTPTETGYKNLLNEGFKEGNKIPFTIDKPGVYHCGDIMYDNSLYFSKMAENTSQILKSHNLHDNQFVLFTMHRPANTDDSQRLKDIIQAVFEIAETNQIKVVFPVHPRTRKCISSLESDIWDKMTLSPWMIIIEPVGFLDIIALESNARLTITDSGGVQKESYFFKRPCLVLRNETEWVEIIDEGAGMLVDADRQNILDGYNYYNENSKIEYPNVFGDGDAATFICDVICKNFS
ncbi:UDP-N-acetylglucosamine 2-epimerase (non-hydrolyzing) [bacterium]|nr:UDP-N-acetylglucosamine 2-epimerase (non-hydrolyzing) [bacterium]